jgi:Zn-dependent peptidase ImmA (M78 family)
VALSYPTAVRAGTQEAGRLHRRLEIKERFEKEGGSIDVFAAIHSLGVPLLARPLKGLLGAYLNDPEPGILITTERRLPIQRFTAAHELGHYALKHRVSLDDESILRRAPDSPEPGPGFQETEADAFAVAFMMPKWLIWSHCARHGWHASDLTRPAVVYQLALRMGASYEATVRTLARYGLSPLDPQAKLLKAKPRDLKIELLREYQPQSYHGDVWLLSESDAGTRIEGSRDDLFVLRLNEHSDGGYIWDFEELRRSGFSIVDDEREGGDELEIGGPVVRRVTGLAEEPEIGQRGRVKIDERRPWQPDPALSSFVFNFDFTGPERGISRAERRHVLEAA